MFDIKAAQDEAKKKIAEERAKKAKTALKAKLASIAAAEQVVANLKREYDALLDELSNGID